MQRFASPGGPIAVRKLPVAVAVSVGLHATAVAFVATHEPKTVRPAPHSEPVHVEILPPSAPDEPIAVAFVDDTSIPQSPAVAAPSAIGSARDRRGHVTTGHTAGSEVGGHEPGTTTGEPGLSSSLMKMRGPELTWSPSAGFFDRFVANTKPLEPEVPATGELAPSAGGTYRSHQGTFTVDVARDGTVDIRDSANAHVHLALPTKRGIGKALSHWAENPAGDEEAPKRQIPGEYKTIGADDKPNSSAVVPVPILGGGFDATDALMRAVGAGDPYSSKKLAVLDETRDERAQIGAKYKHEQLRKANELAHGNLSWIWASKRIDLAAKKRAMFEMWDECAEEGPPDLVEAATKARSMIIAFINGKLPAGSANAYTLEELAELNAHRQSRTLFAPYGN